MAALGFSTEEVRADQEQSDWLVLHVPTLANRVNIITIDTTPLRRKHGNAELKATAAEVLGQLFSAIEEVKVLSAEITQHEIDVMTKEYKTLRTQARKAKDRYENRSKLAQAEGAVRERLWTYNAAVTALKSVRGEKPSEDSFPTDREIANWKTEVEKKKQLLGEATQSLNDAQLYFDGISRDNVDHANELNALIKRINTLRKRLDILEGKTPNSSVTLGYQTFQG